jgi:hypothetical protein
VGLEKGDGRRWELVCRFEREVGEDLVHGVDVDGGWCIDRARLIWVGHGAVLEEEDLGR